jgi:hypothetical protein
MSTPPIPKCEKCGNQETIDQKRDFLGFGKCTCTICKAKFSNPYLPLTKAYRAGFWIIAIWMGSAFINISAENFRAYGAGSYVFFAVVLFAAIRALRIDAVIRKNNSQRSQSSVS